MTDLLTRLEQATEGSRELDAVIRVAAGYSEVGSPLAYSTSLDAALTLVPEDPANPGQLMLWSVTYDEDGVAGPRSYMASLGKGYHDPDMIYGHSAAAAALALCIAALRARG